MIRAILLAGTCLAALASANAAEPQPAAFQADRVVYETSSRVVTLTGSVEVASDGRTLTADTVSYDQRTGIVTASGHVVIRDTDGTTLTADSVVVTGDLRDGVIENIGVIVDEHTRLAAARGTREAGNRTSLESAVFSPCRVCAESGQTEPLWQIKAVRIVWDQQEKRISYEKASFEFFGTPLLVVPEFSHADFTVKNQTGFLAPRVGQSTDLGLFVEVPFHWALDPSYDLTVTTMVATEVNPVLKLDWRQRTERGAYYLSGSFTYDKEYDEFGRQTGERTAYGHIFGRGRFAIDEENSWGFDIERTSSDNYLERYEISDADRLTSRLYWDWRDGRSFANVSLYAFQGLRATDISGRTPLALPDAQLHYVFDETVLEGELALDASFLALHRREGLDTTRASSGLSWRRSEILDGGQSVTLFGLLRGDVYHIRDAEEEFTFDAKDGDVLGRVVTYAGAEIRWPFVRQSDRGSTQIVEPIAQFIVAPYGDGPLGIPNEDSVSLEFDDTNLFSPMKFTGLDLVESGPRANLGLRYAEFFADGGSLEVLAGFEVRTRPDPAFQNTSGLGDELSDYVSRIAYSPWPGLTFVNRLRLDKDDFSVRRNEFYVQGSGKGFEVDASYLKLESDPSLTALGPRQEVSVRGRVYVSEYWSAIGGIRQDLESDETIESRFGMAYEDECSFLELGFRRRYTKDRDAEPSTTLIFSIRLKALGDEGTVEPLFERDPYLGSESRSLNDIESF